MNHFHRYDEIIHLPHPVSQTHPRMGRLERAAACNKPPAAVCHDLRLTMGFFRPFQVGCFLYGGFGYLVVR